MTLGPKLAPLRGHLILDRVKKDTFKQSSCQKVKSLVYTNNDPGVKIDPALGTFVFS